ncbi:MAG: hypothetical protein HYX53_13400 [Chloroflexi bacterium]|nr:hypothetical protein [Chloroflexota bacterium]
MTAARQSPSGVSVVAEAGDPIQAAIWVDALRDAGIEAHTFERGVGAALGGAATGWSNYPVIVPARSLGQARSVLSDLSGASVLAPYRDPAEARARQSQALRIAALVVAGLVAAGVLMRILGG